MHRRDVWKKAASMEVQVSFKMFPDVFFHSILKGNPENFHIFEETDLRVFWWMVDFIHNKNGKAYICMYTCVSLCVREVGRFLTGIKGTSSLEGAYHIKPCNISLVSTSIVLISAFPSLELWPLPSITLILTNPNFQQVKPISGEKSQHVLSTYYVHGT